MIPRQLFCQQHQEKPVPITITARYLSALGPCQPCSLHICLSICCSPCLEEPSPSTPLILPVSIKEGFLSTPTLARPGPLVTGFQRICPFDPFVSSLIGVIIECLSSPLDINSLRAGTVCALLIPMCLASRTVPDLWQES